MAENEKYTGPVITISREFGAGGRSVAGGLSDMLGVKWYDHDFTKIIAKESGYSEEEVKKEGEELSSSERFLDKILNNSMAYTSSFDAIYEAQKEMILKLSSSGEPCIIVGRCANVILKNAGIPSFDVFLYADKDVRIERAKTIKPEGIKDYKKYVEKRDAMRENYYKEYAGEDMNRALDYNICLDTGVISYDTCIEILANIVRKF